MNLRRLNPKAFKRAIRDGGVVGKVAIPKGCACEVKKADSEDGGDRRLQFRISTGSVDRDNDTVNPKGATNLSTFPSTGVVLWAHDARLPPIARPIRAWSEDDAIKAIAEFAPADMDHPLGMGFGETVRRMYVERLMKSVSIGFIPESWSWSEERASDDGIATGIDFETWELLEFSAVPVPANRDALVELAAKGVDLSGVYEWATRCLDGGAGELVVPRHVVEDARKGLAELYGKGQLVIDFAARQTPAAKGALTWADAHPDGTPVADRGAEWDGPAEVAAAEIADLEVMAAWVADVADGEEPTKADFKLPHHAAAGEHPVVWAGVTAAMGALLGARGGVDIPDDDREAVYNHLARHYIDDFEEEPPEFRAAAAGPEGDAGELADGDKSVDPEMKRGRVLSAKNEADLKAARDLISGVIEQVQAQSGDDEPKSLEDELEALAAGEPIELERVDRIVRAAAEIAHKAQPDDPAPDASEPTEEEIVALVREVAVAAAEKAIRKHSGALP